MSVLDSILAMLHAIKDNPAKLQKLHDFMLREIHEEAKAEGSQVPEKYRAMVKEVAGFLDAGMVCYINPVTHEVAGIPSSMLDELDLENEPDNLLDDPYDVYKKDLQRIGSEWENTLTVRPPDAHESFRFMERFVDTLADTRFRKTMYSALHRSKPFRNFNAIIHQSPARKAWFDFKQSCLEEYVFEVIGQVIKT